MVFLQIKHLIQRSTTLKDNLETSPVEKLSGKTLIILKKNCMWLNWHRCIKDSEIMGRESVIVQKQFTWGLHISPNHRHAFNNSFSPFCLKCTIIGITYFVKCKRGINLELDPLTLVPGSTYFTTFLSGNVVLTLFLPLT